MGVACMLVGMAREGAWCMTDSAMETAGVRGGGGGRTGGVA